MKSPRPMARGDFFVNRQFLRRPIWSMSRLPIRTARRDISRGCMSLTKSFVRQAAVALVLAVASLQAVPAWADDGVPVGVRDAPGCGTSARVETAPDTGDRRQRRGEA